MPDPRFSKNVVFINSLVPLAMLVWDAAHGRLGVNPEEAVIHTTGILAIVFLLLSLAVTPARIISGWNFFSHFRRMLGLFAFFYACLHLLAYFSMQRQWDIGGVIIDVVKRKFILIGMLSLLLMLPLAITSTNAMIKRMGAARWKRLHRLAYVAAVAGVCHFWISKKADISQPLAFAIVLALLLAVRVGHRTMRPARPSPLARSAT
jgi:sulfoxide reductase heme-binding subunit YedZ